MASLSEILRALSGARVSPGCSPGCRTWPVARDAGIASADRDSRRARRVESFGLGNIGRKAVRLVLRQRPHRLRPFNNYAQVNCSAGLRGAAVRLVSIDPPEPAFGSSGSQDAAE